MKIYNFANEVNENELFYAYSPQSRTTNKFAQYNGYIANKEMPVANESERTLNDFEHISLLTKQTYGVGTTITLECDFDNFGAPLLLLTNDLITINGVQSYDRHVELVAFENGLNVWDITYAPDKPERHFIAPIKTAFKRFEIDANERIFITAKILENGLLVTVNGETLQVEIPNMPQQAYVGLTACEGINRFYTLKIED